jgi:hypothetical protein
MLADGSKIEKQPAMRWGRHGCGIRNLRLVQQVEHVYRDDEDVVCLCVKQKIMSCHIPSTGRGY